MSDAFLSETDKSVILPQTMNLNVPLVTTQQYVVEVEKWVRALARGENLSVVFFPKTDRLRRLQQFLNDPNLQKKFLGESGSLLFRVLEFGIHNVEDEQDLCDHISIQLNYSRLLSTPQSFDQWMTYLSKNDIRLVLILPLAEEFLNPESRHILSLFSLLVDKYQSLIVTLCFFEVDVSNPEVLPKLPNSSRLFQNLFYYPLYSREGSLNFVQYLEKKWNFDLDKKTEQYILDQCGGHFWLLKEAVRQRGSLKSEFLLQEGMRFRIQMIYNLLLPSEQRLLEKLVTKKQNLTNEERHSREYLQRMNVIKYGDDCAIGLMKDFILDQGKDVSQFQIKNSRITLNQVPLEQFFSRKEYRVVKLLLENKGQIVPRDEIAKHIWPINTQEQYSDWAIDQLIARVRKRLIQLSLPPTLLQVLRGKGYLLRVS